MNARVRRRACRVNVRDDYKLDWVFVRPFSLTDPHGAGPPCRFAPHFGRTLKELNQSIPGRISDHNPITVDLPLGEPPTPGDR